VVDLPGTYVAQLMVHDGQLDSAPDTVVITTENTRPMANAGPDQTVVVGTTVHLDGSKSSDVDGDRLTLRWALTAVPSGSTATLSDPTLVNPTFAVDKAGTYLVRLIVNDGTLDSAPATVTITTTNSRPVANAGPDQTVLVVSHKATNRLLLCSLMGIDERFYREKVTQDLACLNVLKFKAPSQARVVVMNDVSHYLTVPAW